MGLERKVAHLHFPCFYTPPKDSTRKMLKFIFPCGEVSSMSDDPKKDAYDACLACMALLEKKEPLTKDQLYSLQRWASLINAKSNQMVCEVTGQVNRIG